MPPPANIPSFRGAVGHLARPRPGDSPAGSLGSHIRFAAIGSILAACQASNDACEPQPCDSGEPCVSREQSCDPTEYDVAVHVDFSTSSGTIANMNGVQGPPQWKLIPQMDLTQYYVDAHVPMVRFPQDDGYDYALSSIFPDASADADDPASYHFDDIDDLLESVLATGAEPIWQAIYDIGPNENWGMECCQGGDQPDDSEKWADVVKHVVMHWNDGWADGHEWGISHVEFINEPVVCGGFVDDKEVIFAVYRDFVDALESYEQEYGRELVLMGPAADLPEDYHLTVDYYVQFLDDLLQGRRIDIFSMHTYRLTPWEIYEGSVAIKEIADAFGMPVCNSEWNRIGNLADGTDELSHWTGVFTTTARILLEPILDCSIVYRAPPLFLFPDLKEYDESPFFDCQQGDCQVEPGWFSFMPFRDLAGMDRLAVSYPEAMAEGDGFAAMAGLDGQNGETAILLSSLEFSGTIGVFLDNVPENLRENATLATYRLEASSTDWEPTSQEDFQPGESGFLSLQVEAPDLWFLVLQPG